MEAYLRKHFKLDSLRCEVSISIVIVPRPYKGVGLERRLASAIIREAHEQCCTGMQLLLSAVSLSLLLLLVVDYWHEPCPLLTCLLPKHTCH